MGHDATDSAVNATDSPGGTGLSFYCRQYDLLVAHPDKIAAVI